MRIKGESPEELLGFTAAVQDSLPAVSAQIARLGAGAVVVLPSYNGARKLPNLTPLLALLLAQEGVPVLVHGITEDTHRTTSAQIFDALGMPAAHTAADVADRWAQRLPAFMPLRTLHPCIGRPAGFACHAWRAQFGAHTGQAAAAGAGCVAGGEPHPPRVRQTAWPCSSRRAGPRRCSCAAPKASPWPTPGACRP